MITFLKIIHTLVEEYEALPHIAYALAREAVLSGDHIMHLDREAVSYAQASEDAFSAGEFDYSIYCKERADLYEHLGDLAHNSTRH